MNGISSVHKLKKKNTFFKQNNWHEWLGNHFDVEPRFHKALQHLQERKATLDAEERECNKEIEYYDLVRELDEDLQREQCDFIKECLWTHFEKTVKQWHTSVLKKQ